MRQWPSQVFGVLIEPCLVTHTTKHTQTKGTHKLWQWLHKRDKLMSGCGFGLVDVVHQTLCFFLSFQTTLVQSVFCVHPHILLHSTSIPQHTATTTMPTVSPTTTQSLRTDTAIASFVHTFHHPFLPALCIHSCLWSTLLHFKTHCVFTPASHNHIGGVFFIHNHNCGLLSVNLLAVCQPHSLKRERWGQSRYCLMPGRDERGLKESERGWV